MIECGVDRNCFELRADADNAYPAEQAYILGEFSAGISQEGEREVNKCVLSTFSNYTNNSSVFELFHFINFHRFNRLENKNENLTPSQ